MDQFISADTLKEAIQQLKGTAGPFFRIWLTLKRMGLTDTSSVEITTGSSTTALNELFFCGEPTGKLFTPMAPTPSDLFMSGEAGRSVIQTNIRQWMDGTGTKDPTKILEVSEGVSSGREKPLIVRTVRQYPQGLGQGKDGFAAHDDERVCVPILALAIWWNRIRPIPTGKATPEFLIQTLLTDLKITAAEEICVFVPGPSIHIVTRSTKLTDAELHAVVAGVASGPKFEPIIVRETAEENKNKVQKRKTIIKGPKWLNVPPETQLNNILATEAKAVLLFGPPRTGKTRAINALIPQTRSDRVTIQIHDGWGYDQLIEGQIIKDTGATDWSPGVLLKALRNPEIKHIVLEEVNRTLLTQSLGEVFSVMETKYRGEGHAVALRSGGSLFIPPDVTIYMTMNTVDKSTEEVDDALLGRLPGVEFGPRVEDLINMLTAQAIDPAVIDSFCSLFAVIQKHYPLGHGYFAALKPTDDPIAYYVSRIRPVLLNHLLYSQPEVLDLIDNSVDGLFSL